VPRSSHAFCSAGPGACVGLHTSWRIVRLHGGRVDAASPEGKWAEFRFELPQPLAAAGEGDAA